MLEIGFGNGRTVPEVIRQAADIQYTGIDLSPTMLEAASRFNAALVAAGQASFHLGSSDHMPFPDSTFDRGLRSCRASSAGVSVSKTAMIVFRLTVTLPLIEDQSSPQMV